MSGFYFILGSAFMNGLMLPLSKSVVDRYPAYQFMFYMSILAVLFGLFFSPRDTIFPKRWLHGPDRFWFLAHTLTVSLALWSFWEGVKYVSPTVAALIANTQVVFVFILGSVFLAEKISFRFITGALIVGGGVLILKSEGGSLNIHIEKDYGLIMVIVSALSFAVADLCIKYTSASLRMIPFVNLRNIILALIFASLAGYHGGLVLPPWEDLAVIAGASSMGLFMGRLFYNWGLKRLSMSLAILIFQTYPLFTVFWSYFLLGEVPSAYQWLGGSVLVLGIVFLLLPQLKPLFQKLMPVRTL
jgi:drug/metabolite transporter (DMT)-like permease